MPGRIAAANVKLKRAYAPAEPGDGRRILVDRLWPRGLAKSNARVDAWIKDIAPSAGLRRWFAHDPSRWDTFCARYARELATRPDLVDELRAHARDGPITLLFSARDETHNNAVALRNVLLGRHSGGASVARRASSASIRVRAARSAS